MKTMLLTLVLTYFFGSPSYAAEPAQKISDLRTSAEQLERQAGAIDVEIENLRAANKRLQSRVESLSAELQNLADDDGDGWLQRQLEIEESQKQQVENENRAVERHGKKGELKAMAESKRRAATRLQSDLKEAHRTNPKLITKDVVDGKQTIEDAARERHKEIAKEKQNDVGRGKGQHDHGQENKRASARLIEEANQLPDSMKEDKETIQRVAEDRNNSGKHPGNNQKNKFAPMETDEQKAQRMKQSEKEPFPSKPSPDKNSPPATPPAPGGGSSDPKPNAPKSTLLALAKEAGGALPKTMEGIANPNSSVNHWTRVLSLHVGYLTLYQAVLKLEERQGVQAMRENSSVLEREFYVWLRSKSLRCVKGRWMLVFNDPYWTSQSWRQHHIDMGKSILFESLGAEKFDDLVQEQRRAYKRLMEEGEEIERRSKQELEDLKRQASALDDLAFSVAIEELRARFLRTERFVPAVHWVDFETPDNGLGPFQNQVRGYRYLVYNVKERDQWNRYVLLDGSAEGRKMRLEEFIHRREQVTPGLRISDPLSWFFLLPDALVVAPPGRKVEGERCE